MSLLFIDGFDHYATADITKKWNSISGTVTINAAAGRRGGGAMKVANQNYAAKSVDASSTVVLGFALYPIGSVGQITNAASHNAAGSILLQGMDGVSVQFKVSAIVDGSIAVLNSAGTILAQSATGIVSAAMYDYYEVKVTINNTTGSVEIRKNGVSVCSASGLGTQNTANASVNSIRYYGLAYENYFDDLYIVNSTGSVNNNFLGDVRVDTLFPTADGTYSQFTPSTGTTHYTLVDEASVNTTDYNSSTTAGHKDSYGMGNLPTSPTTVHGVQACAAVTKMDAGARGVKLLVRSGATDGLGAEVAPSTSQTIVTAIFETDPNTATAWTESTVNGAEAGLQIST